MLITDKKLLTKYSAPYRIWQGIPGIAVTKKGRIFSAFYSGTTMEGIGNFVVLQKSDDDTKTFEMVAVAYQDGLRCFDEVVWMDPMGRLWFIWSVAATTEGLYASVCDDPDADELQWSDVFFIGRNVMMNKPTILKDGEWLFPIAVWAENIRWGKDQLPCEEETGAFVYGSKDNGKTFQKKGGACAFDRCFDEHMTLELQDGRLMMLIRTHYGIGVSYSSDKGETWSEGENSGIAGPCSRFYISRLHSGRVLLINHYEFQGRNNLTALLSEDDCKTWKYKLLLDERAWVSYPDAQQTQDGVIHITYDRERGCFKKSMKDVYADAREILYARITEEDIMAGKLVDKNSRLKVVLSALGEYVGEDPFSTK